MRGLLRTAVSAVPIMAFVVLVPANRSLGPFHAASVPSCSSSALSTSASGVGVTTGSTDIAEFTFTNAGTTTCTLSGAPQVEVVDSSETVIATATASSAGPYGYYEATEVTLSAGDSALAYLAFSALGSCPAGATLSVNVSGGWQGISTLPVSEMCGINLLISPIVPSTVPVFSTYGEPTLTEGPSPLADGAGYFYGTDSGSTPCSGVDISYNGLNGYCGFYGGEIGAYWQDISNCLVGGWGWITSQAIDANEATSDGGTGTSPIFFVGGPGMDPNYDYGLALLAVASGACPVGASSSTPQKTSSFCERAHLQVSLPHHAGDVAVVMMGDIFTIWFRNKGGPCDLKGYPVLSLQSHGHRVAFHQLDPVDGNWGTFKPVPVKLKTGGLAAVLVEVGRVSDTTSGCATSMGVRITRSARPFELSLGRLRVCPGSYRSHQIAVSAYHPASVPIFGVWPSG